MKNAYKILGVAQDANSVDIVKGQINAMKEGRYNSNEIALAKKQLSTPALRLAADFMYSILEKPNIPLIVSTIQPTEIDLDTINEDAFNSLK
jgi:hypothetical protein